MPTFREVLDQVVAIYGSQAAAAKAIGMDRTRFGRVFQDPERESLDLVNCLRLARAVAMPPSEVLGAAGRASDHQLIQDLYGNEKAPSDLKPSERTVLAILRQEKGSNDLFHSLNEDDAPDAVRAYARAIGRIGEILIQQAMEEIRRRDPLGRPRRSTYRSSDPQSYLREVEAEESKLFYRLEKVGRSCDEADLDLLRLRLQDLVSASDAADSDQVSPIAATLKKLADTTRSNDDATKDIERNKAIKAAKSNPDMTSRCARLQRLILHARLTLRDAVREGRERDVDDARSGIHRLTFELDGLLGLGPAGDMTSNEDESTPNLTPEQQRQEIEESNRIRAESRVRSQELRQLALSKDLGQSERERMRTLSAEIVHLDREALRHWRHAHGEELEPPLEYE